MLVVVVLLLMVLKVSFVDVVVGDVIVIFGVDLLELDK